MTNFLYLQKWNNHTKISHLWNRDAIYGIVVLTWGFFPLRAERGSRYSYSLREHLSWALVFLPHLKIRV
jgi:hypothetical protein